MAQASGQVELPQSFQASTEAALQRFTRGQRSMGTLLKVLKDYEKMEQKISQIYYEFLQKWEEKSRTQVGSNLAYDEMKAIMKILMATYREQLELQNKSVNSLNGKKGPIRILQDYIDSEDVQASRKATQSLYERTNKRQVKLEKEIGQLKEDYFLAKDRMIKFKPEMDAAQTGQEGRTSFQELLSHWRKLESDTAEAKTSYRQKVEEEKSTRPTFIKDMKGFQNKSDAYERTRLQNLHHVMTSMMRNTKAVEVKRYKVLKPLYEEGSSRLQQYNLQKEVDCYNAFYLYQHQFPEEQLHPSEASAKKTDEEFSQRTPQDEQSDKISIIQDLSAKDKTDRLFIKTAVHPDAEKSKAPRYSRRVTNTTPNSKEVCRMPETEIPNLVTDKKPTAAPMLMETVLESDKDSCKCSDSDSDEEQSQGQPKATDISNITQGQKVKVYAMKDFSARATDEISFKAGRKIYVTESAVAGRVYGYIKKGKLIKKRTYGYFPEQLVSTDKTFKVKQTLKKKLSKHLPHDSSKNISFMGNSG
ncbi:protein kinase C and casein kinase substrate in neurons protein 2-like [Haliotis asinina]|uniref:protein kinase C and casein kinase substrate in neurons protein 2-like n=1 Tax=Haliotis asinina TaxID=109174 RepID=UPI003531CF66